MAATVLALPYDGWIREEYTEHKNDLNTDISEHTTSFGDYRYQIPLHTYLWSLGTAFNYLPMKKAAADGIEASLLSAGLVTPLITVISGRALPIHNEKPLKFHPFIFKSGHESFPSGHTTEAFAMAAVLDANFRQTFGYWHTPFLFALSTATAYSRVYDQKHYLSDVILGAGIGTSIGYWVAGQNHNVPSYIFIWPTPNGFVLVWEF